MAEQEGGESRGWRKGAIPHKQALSPPEVWECVSLRWRRRCAGVWSGEWQSPNGPVRSKSLKKTGRLM